MVQIGFGGHSGGFEARYAGVCRAKGDVIEPGDVIVEFDDGYRHKMCRPTSPERHGNVCPKCNLEMPVTGVCDNCS